MVTVIIAVAQVSTAVLAAYAFAFLRFPFRRTMFVVFMATLMMPIEVTLMANVEAVRTFGEFNSYKGLAASVRSADSGRRRAVNGCEPTYAQYTDVVFFHR